MQKQLKPINMKPECPEHPGKPATRVSSFIVGVPSDMEVGDTCVVTVHYACSCERQCEAVVVDAPAS